jgi:hypothetical protein
MSTGSLVALSFFAVALIALLTCAIWVWLNRNKRPPTARTRPH